jgi:hypothetical protein
MGKNKRKKRKINWLARLSDAINAEVQAGESRSQACYNAVKKAHQEGGMPSEELYQAAAISLISLSEPESDAEVA